ncbi:unnamed protein product, partial [Meganyctiphanes norvegica]
MDSSIKEGVDNPAFKSDESTDNPPVVVEVPEVDNGRTKSMKFVIMKNIIIMSIAFTFNFTAYNAMANLQSSINAQLGTASLSTLYAALVVSCMFVPSWLIRKLKYKKTTALCMLAYSTYIAAQFYPEYYTLVPTAIIVGIGAAPMWSAQCSYFTQAGQTFAKLTGEDSEVVVTRFFGIFFLFFQSSQIWGNLISSLVLNRGAASADKNATTIEEYCGANFMPGVDIPFGEGEDANEIRDEDRYLMSGIYLACAILSSAIVFIFVDPLSKFCTEETSNSNKTGLQLVVATFNLMRNPYQLLIIPLTIWSGLEQAFIGADFTASYVQCGLGVEMVGYVLICYGVVDSIFSLSLSHVVKLVGRIPVFTMGAVINFSVIIALLFWVPDPDQPVLFFVFAGLWGVSDAVWQTQINAFYGVLFPGQSEAAFSNYRLWESLGFIIAYACSTAIGTDAKIYMLIVFIILGIAGYYAIEIIEKKGGLRKDSNGKVIKIDRY